MGLSDDAGFAKYHHVLNRAVWSPLQLSRVLLILLIEHLAQDDEPLVFGIDETLERRRGSRMSAKGVFRDAVRSSETHLVRASGLRWASLMWLTHIPCRRYSSRSRLQLSRTKRLTISHTTSRDATLSVQSPYFSFVAIPGTQSVFAAGPVQEAGLDARVTTGRRRSNVLARWRKRDIVLAVYSQTLNDLQGVLLMFIRVGVRGLKERR